MNQLMQQCLTMSSREIAELLNKNHSDIKRSAKRLSDGGILTKPLAESEFNHNGNVYIEYLLEKRDCFVLVAQNCPEFTAVIVDRWQELEAKQNPQLPDFNNPVEAARAWADEAEQKQIAQKQLELAKPKVAFVDNLVDRTNLLTATQVAQKHKMSAIKLNRYLDELKVYNKSVKRGRVFNQWFIDKCYGEIKKTELGYVQPLFTNAGEIWIAEKLITEGAE